MSREQRTLCNPLSPALPGPVFCIEYRPHNSQNDISHVIKVASQPIDGRVQRMSGDENSGIFFRFSLSLSLILIMYIIIQTWSWLGLPVWIIYATMSMRVGGWARTYVPHTRKSGRVYAKHGRSRHNLHCHQHTPEHDVALRDTLYRRRPMSVTFNRKWIIEILRVQIPREFHLLKKLIIIYI